MSHAQSAITEQFIVDLRQIWNWKCSLCRSTSKTDMVGTNRCLPNDGLVIKLESLKYQINEGRVSSYRSLSSGDCFVSVRRHMTVY